MDALPLTEDTGLDFASEVPGVMHACGHDTHVAMLLGAARLLVERRDQLAGRVLLMFQPGEEGPHGARLMLEEGLLEEGPHGAGDVQRAVAIHISTRYAAGTIAPAARRPDGVRGRVPGDRPRPRRSRIVAAPRRSTRSRRPPSSSSRSSRRSPARIDVFDPAVLTIGRISGGTTNNIIPETVEIEGTIRTVSPKARATMHDLVRRVAKGVGRDPRDARGPRGHPRLPGHDVRPGRYGVGPRARDRPRGRGAGPRPGPPDHGRRGLLLRHASASRG